MSDIDNELNALADRLFIEKANGNKDLVFVLRNEIWEKAYEKYVLSSYSEDAFVDAEYDKKNDALLSCIDKYNGSGKFANYLKHTLKFRELDAYNAGKHQQTYKSAGGAKSVSIDYDKHLDDPVNEGSEKDDRTLGDTISSPKTSADSNVMFDSLISDIIAFLDVNEKTSAAKKIWYHIFFTEGITSVCKENVVKSDQEKQIFNTVDDKYLDYYMSEICRSLREINGVPLKLYGELVEGQSMDRITPVPLPAAVSLGFLKKYHRDIRASKSGRSNFLNSFKEDMSFLKG